MMSKRFMFAAKNGKLAGAVMQSEEGGDERGQERKTIRMHSAARILVVGHRIFLSRHYSGH